MELTEEICTLITNIENIIGSECYNPNSYDGWNDVEGCEFRYPVTVKRQSGSYEKVRSNVTSSYLWEIGEFTPESIKYMKYKFGSNELFIGLGIIKTLEFLEKSYGLDFNELAKNSET